jgi:transposase
VGCLPTPLLLWCVQAVDWFGVGARPDGSFTVALSTPFRILVSLTEAPGQPAHHRAADARRVVCGAGTQEIEDPEHEQVLARVAAIDVAKATGMVSTRVPHEKRPGRRLTKVWEVAATTNAIVELADHLVCQSIERVVVESTSDYWRPFFYLLEARGLQVWLVNAREVKHLPGRPKTDRLDSVWLAKLTERGMLRPSFVPPSEIRRLRDYTRLRHVLTQDRTRYYNRLEKLLEDALIKVSSVASKMNTVSVQDMIEALIAGERDPKALAQLARRSMRAKIPALEQALNGSFDDHHGELAQCWTRSMCSPPRSSASPCGSRN